MSKHVVSRVLQVCGPCRIVHAGAPNMTLLEDLLLAGCDAYAFGPSTHSHPRWIGDPSGQLAEGTLVDAVLVEMDSAGPASEQLIDLLARFGPKTLVLLAHGVDRQAMETQLFANSWRRHPGGLAVYEYAGLSDVTLGKLSFYERTSGKGLPGDMLRQYGARADAPIARYALAAQFVRPGDTVLDCAAGPGYGTAILASLSDGAAFLGVEPDQARVEYARLNYTRDGVTYRVGEPSNLKDIPDASIDLVVSMDTLERAPDWRATLKEFHRVLKPDGRLVTSVPDRRTTDPNIFDWAELEKGLNQYFFVEARYDQTSPSGPKLPGASRALHPVALDAETETEWIIAVAAMNPIEGQGRGDFKHPAFHASLEKSGAAIVDFGRYYDNPYLYRTMIQMGERLRHDLKLATLAHWVIMNARPDSADRGAAICVFGYQILDKREVKLAAGVLDFVRDYLRVTAAEEKNSHVLRWRLSLNFLAGRLCELLGDRDHAAQWYHAAAECDWRPFSPILATKSVGACFFEGRIHLANGDVDQARICFSHGLEHALTAVKGDLNDIVGDPEQPVPFGLTELAEVIDMGSQCANAIVYLPLWNRDPGLFWKHVDVKRFGLASWALDLERENQQLRSLCESQKRE